MAVVSKTIPAPTDTAEAPKNRRRLLTWLSSFGLFGSAIEFDPGPGRLAFKGYAHGVQDDAVRGMDHPPIADDERRLVREAHRDHALVSRYDLHGADCGAAPMPTRVDAHQLAADEVHQLISSCAGGGTPAWIGRQFLRGHSLTSISRGVGAPPLVLRYLNIDIAG